MFLIEPSSRKQFVCGRECFLKNCGEWTVYCLIFESCVMKINILISISLLLCSCQAKLPVNVPELSDGDPTTCFVGTDGVNKIVFDQQYTVPFQSYKIYSSGETPAHDPSAWTLKGS